MRPFWIAAGVFFALAASDCSAAPLVFPNGPTLRDGHPAHPGLRAPAPRVPRKPLGVDRAEAVRRTSGVQYQALVILLQFTDQAADTINHDSADFDTLLFSQGTHPTGSLRDYFNEVSLGRFDIDGVVTRWYTAPRPYSDYANNLGGFGAPPLNAQQMALDAVRTVDDDVDFSLFDNDGPDGIPHSGDDNGVVDALFIVHAGPGGEETASNSDIRSHKWNVPGGAVLVDGVSVSHYTTEPERWQNTTPWTTAGDLISVGVFCHEFGHVLGLPDLYDTSGSPEATEGIGEWDLMASGVYTHLEGGALGSKPAHLSAWSKVALGWAEPTWVTQDSLGVTIPPAETTGQVFRLWTNGVEESEYFLVENRQPLGFDAGLVRSSIETGGGPAHGLLIYHVDGGIFGNNNAAHKMVDVEEGGGVEPFTGVQNLDLARGSIAPQTVCDGAVNVRGDRGDSYDPWPGAAARTSFEVTGCPASGSYCGKISQVAVSNIAETGGTITADFLVTGTTVRRRAVIVDDAPSDEYPNNGNGLAEPGETVRLYVPLQNLGLPPTGEVYAKLTGTEIYAGLLADSIYYGVIGGGEVDTGTVLLAAINSTPDPRGMNFKFDVYGPSGLVQTDSLQILIGRRSGICESFESTQRRWVGVPSGCGGVDEWHREAGVNHTPGGAWAWRLGPAGMIGSYAASQDARLVSQPIRIAGAGDTLRFWHRYDTEFAFDGLTVEVTRNGGITWTALTPVGGYNTGDRWSGSQPTFTEAAVPLTGSAGVVQIAFRFRSQPPTEGLGWWIDDVTVTGDASCSTTGIAVERFTATAQALLGRPSVRLEWAVASDKVATIGIDRAIGGAERRRLATISNALGAEEYVDFDVVPGLTHAYWLTASREGEPTATAGPVLVEVPDTSPGSPPRAFALSRIRPNPFQPRAAFSVSLDREGPFVVRVFRVDGSLVRTLAKGRSAPAEIAYTWDGTDDRGRAVGAGLYLFELRSGNRTRVQKAVLLR